MMKKILSYLVLAAALLCAPISAHAQFADQATYVAAPGGTANAITLAVDNWSANRPGIVIRFLPASQNTGATTANVSGVGATAIRRLTGLGPTPLVGGELNPTEIASITFDGTYFILNSAPALSPTSGGYLTPCQPSSPSPVSGCSVGQYFPTGTVTSATTLYYASANGSNIVPIFNGGVFVPRAVTESQMTLILSSSANLADHLYDVCVYDNAGTPAIGTSVGWTNFGNGTSSRGTGGGSAQAQMVNGVWVNSVAVTVTNNNIGVSVPAGKCTIVATLLVDAVNGQATFHRTVGQSRRWAVFNFFNRLPLTLTVADPASAFNTGNSATPAPQNSSATNSLRFPVGLATPISPVILSQTSTTTTAGGSSTFISTSIFGIGFNVTNAYCGASARNGQNAANLGAVAYVITMTLIAQCNPGTIFGVNLFTALSSYPASGAIGNLSGSPDMAMTAEWNG